MWTDIALWIILIAMIVLIPCGCILTRRRPDQLPHQSPPAAH